MLLTVRETAGVDRRTWPVTCGIPFPDGDVRAEAIEQGRYRLRDDGGQPVLCQAEVAATWGTYPSGSNGYIKWVHVHFLADVEANGSISYAFEVNVAPDDVGSGLVVEDGDQSVTITTGQGVGALRLVVARDRFNVLDDVWLDVAGDGFGDDDRIIARREAPNLTMAYDHRAVGINAHRPEVVVEQAGPVLAVVRVATKLDNRFESVVRLYAYAGSAYVRVQETLVHGPTGQDRTAVRSQPVVMKSHAMELPISVGDGSTVTMGVGESLPEPPQWATVTQRLSDDGRVVLEQDLCHDRLKDNVGPDRLSRAFSYGVIADGELVHEGKRAPGWLDVSDQRWGVTAAVRNFWQTFPKRLVAEPGLMRLEHWAHFAQLHPVSRNFNWMGMAKTHEVGLYFHVGDAVSSGASSMAQGRLVELFATCEPEYYCHTQAYGNQLLTPAIKDGQRAHPKHDELLATGLNRDRSVDNGFYHFREVEDDYGYFNFGDFQVFEYWGCQEYDPAYCMLQQFYRTGQLEYVEFAAECARYLYDMLYSHTYTPETSNYPQREHDKRSTCWDGDESHGQDEMNTDCGHVFLAGLMNYWYLTGDPRAKDVISWSLPIYLADDWYRIGGGGTWRYLGGYLCTVMRHAYEWTWDDRYVELMNWVVRQFMVNGVSRHEDGIWWEREGDGYLCQPWLGDSVTNGYTQYLEVYPGSPYRQAIESGIVNLANFLVERGFSDNHDGLVAHLTKPTKASQGYRSSGSIYRKGMGSMATLTLARAYYLTGDADRYLPIVSEIRHRVFESMGTLDKLKPVVQACYYAPMILPYVEGAIQPRGKDETFEPVAPVDWASARREQWSSSPDRNGVLWLGDELAGACAPPDRRGRAFGNHQGWRLSDVMGCVDHLLATHRPSWVVLLIGGSDLPLGHPERTDFEVNYTMLVRRVLSAGALPVLVTLPPASHLEPFAWQNNAVIYQAAVLNRVPLVDLRERMRDRCPDSESSSRPKEKVPEVDAIAQNRFADGHAAIVTAEVARIVGR